MRPLTWPKAFDRPKRSMTRLASATSRRSAFRSSTALFRLDARGLDHGLPARELRLEESLELAARAGDHVEALRLEARPVVRVLQRPGDGGVQLRGDLSGHALGRDHRLPRIDLESGKARLDHRRHVGKLRHGL